MLRATFVGPPMDFDDAYEVLIKFLAALPESAGRVGPQGERPRRRSVDPACGLLAIAAGPGRRARGPSLSAVLRRGLGAVPDRRAAAGRICAARMATDVSLFSGDMFNITAVSEVEAHMRLTDLLRLAQFAHEHWSKLTA